MEIIISNRGSEIARVAELLDRLGARQGLDADTLADMQVAVDEVLANITSYAHSDGAEHQIHIRIELLEDGLQAVIEDDGVAFDPLAAAPPDVGAPLQERHVGGVGIHFVKSLMDDVTYERVGDRNRLVLKKRLKR